MVVLENMGPNPLISILIQVYPFVFILLPLLAWIYLYRKGAEARDLIFWGVISLVIPLLGPIAAMLYIRRRDKHKRKLSDWRGNVTGKWKGGGNAQPGSD